MEMKDKIKMLREQHGLTLEDVGKVVGVGKSTVRKWETGDIANMRRDKIAKLAEALHTTPAYLMGWDIAPDADLVFQNLAMIITEENQSGRTDARDTMIKTHGVENDTHILRVLNGKYVFMYYHAFTDQRSSSAASALMYMLEKITPSDAEHLQLLVEAYTAADARARQMVDLALDPFLSKDRKEWFGPLASEDDAEELARQIIQDKQTGGQSSASNGGAGKKKEA